MKRLSRNAKLAIAIYFISLIVYLSASGNRLLHKSGDIHFSYQAQMFLQHRLDLGHPPPNSNDWAEVEYLKLKDGRTVAGTFLRSQPMRFRTLNGEYEMIPADRIENRWKKYYVSFPPFPALIFLPFVAVAGLEVNDVVVTIFLAALAPALLFLGLRRLSARGDSVVAGDGAAPAQPRSETDDLWLTAMFAFGTVYFYTAVVGQVWYTAHVVATVLTTLFVLAALDLRHPALAGLCIGGILLTRPHVAAWALLFLHELWRQRPATPAGAPARKWHEGLAWGALVQFAAPVVVLGALGFAFNWARFHQLGEFGHFYLNVRWTDRIQRYGLTNFAFLARNLSVMLTLTPKLLPRPPYFQLSWHGLSLLITTPAFVYVLWPRVKSSLHTALWVIVAPIMLMGLLYQNDGWVQFGYRFSNDFALALILLLAVGGRPLTRTWKALIVVGVAVNLFGAVTFGRLWQFYFDGFFPISPNEL